MVENYINTNKIDRKKSFIIGDQLSDMEFGDNLKINKILITNGTQSKQSNKNSSFLLVNDLFDAVRIIQSIKLN